MKFLRFVCLAVLAGCGTVPLDVINDPVPGAVGASCAVNEDCLADLFCERTVCFQELGTCAARPTSCEPVMDIKCGCDGLTYLNSCYRQLAGVDGERGPGPCMQMNSKRCGMGRTCPPGSFCGRLLGGPESCQRPPDEAPCTVGPEHCSGGRPEQFYVCGESPAQCLDFCAAIRREQPVYRTQGSFCP